MSPTPEIKGWCPGAFAPMASNDGLLIRAKVIGSRIGAAQLAALAAISTDCGNGLVDLSQRAQLQLRGVSEATLADALRRLDESGLLAADAGAERVTNIVASPLAGLDRRTAFNANDMAQALAAALQADPVLRALPAKFLFEIDDGGQLTLADVDADICIEPAGPGHIAIRIAGAQDRAVIIDSSQAIISVQKLARAFVALREGAFELRRMRRLVAVTGAEALFREAELAAQPYASRAIVASRAILGAREAQGFSYAGVAAPFGRWRAQDLAQMAAFAAQHGLGEIRLTPWRALLLPVKTLDAAKSIVIAAQTLDLIASPDDPRLAVAACPGAPECPQALGETRAHLALLAPLAHKLSREDGVSLHVSGCAKGCAHPGASMVTLVADGALFDLIDNGRAADAPRLKGLTIRDVERALALRAEEQSCPTP